MFGILQFLLCVVFVCECKVTAEVAWGAEDDFVVGGCAAAPSRYRVG